MIEGQYEGIMGVLEEIRDRLPVRDIPDPIQPHEHRASCHGPAGELVCQQEAERIVREYGTPARTKAAQVAADKRQALAAMRAVLDDWIKGAQDNHDALGHRRHVRGEECWRSFAPSDIRNMINDAARELGLEEFPLPTKAEEDRRR